jgi:hypothetical protein
VVAPGFLANPEVLRWLNGVMPAWTMLEFGSFNALHQEPSASNKAIRLEPNLTETDLSGSAVTRTARILLQRAALTLPMHKHPEIEETYVIEDRSTTTTGSAALANSSGDGSDRCTKRIRMRAVILAVYRKPNVFQQAPGMRHT